MGGLGGDPKFHRLYYIVQAGNHELKNPNTPSGDSVTSDQSQADPGGYGRYLFFNVLAKL